jgi:hypothetical protein
MGHRRVSFRARSKTKQKEIEAGMNHEELKKILAEQRTRRTARTAQHSPAPREKRFDGGFERSIWMLVAAIVFVLFAGLYLWTTYFLAKSLDAGVTTKASLFSAPVAPPSVMATDPASVSAKVCTDIPDGRLHVRFTPGEGGEVRGYLVEGESVQIALVNGQMETQTAQGEQWLKLLSPVEGWSNFKYICEVENAIR